MGLLFNSHLSDYVEGWKRSRSSGRWQAETSEKQARSIKYQLTVAKLPLAKDINDFDFTGTPIKSAVAGLFRLFVVRLQNGFRVHWSFEYLRINFCRVVHGDTPPPIGNPKDKKRQN